jgi:hypothetical protein
MEMTLISSLSIILKLLSIKTEIKGRIRIVGTSVADPDPNPVF